MRTDPTPRCAGISRHQGACARLRTAVSQRTAKGWWAEYAVADPNVASVSLVVPGMGTVALTWQWGKSVGSTGFRVPSGTLVTLQLSSVTRQSAETTSFRYLVDTAPAFEACP